mmetsp:Transcript_10486/g.23696  ORF Transcript_10486/g.23696 Transcript_10486/m.23696 type:complete len:377 (+) Transcript_10486:407-1537(+)
MGRRRSLGVPHARHRRDEVPHGVGMALRKQVRGDQRTHADQPQGRVVRSGGSRGELGRLHPPAGARGAGVPQLLPRIPQLPAQQLSRPVADARAARRADRVCVLLVPPFTAPPQPLPEVPQPPPRELRRGAHHGVVPPVPRACRVHRQLRHPPARHVVVWRRIRCHVLHLPARLRLSQRARTLQLRDTAAHKAARRRAIRALPSLLPRVPQPAPQPCEHQLRALHAHLRPHLRNGRPNLHIAIADVRSRAKVRARVRVPRPRRGRYVMSSPAVHEPGFCIQAVPWGKHHAPSALASHLPSHARDVGYRAAAAIRGRAQGDPQPIAAKATRWRGQAGVSVPPAADVGRATPWLALLPAVRAQAHQLHHPHRGAASGE